MTDNKPILTPLQKAEAEKVKAQQDIVIKIHKLLEDNKLTLVVGQNIKVVPKQ